MSDKNESYERHEAGYCHYAYYPPCDFCNDDEVKQHYEETEHGLPF
jgi:hypothetical protein